MGIYLLCSLGFVFYGLIELAAIIALKRRNMKKKIRPREGNGRKFNKISFQNKESRRFGALNRDIKQGKITKHMLDTTEPNSFEKMDTELELLRNIDYHSVLGYFITYALFNCFYWIDMFFY